MGYHDDPNSDPNRERPLAGVTPLLTLLCLAFAVYLIAKNFQSDTVRQIAKNSVSDGLSEIGKEVDSVVTDLRQLFAPKQLPFGRDYPKGTRRVAPRFKVSVKDFGTRREVTWVTSKYKGRRTTEYRYWGWHNRRGPIFTIAINYRKRGWKEKSLTATLRGTAALGRQADVTELPTSIPTNLGQVEFVSFTNQSAFGTRNCIGFQKFSNERAVKLKGAACGHPGQTVNADALACIISGAVHPHLPKMSDVHDPSACSELFSGAIAG